MTTIQELISTLWKSLFSTKITMLRFYILMTDKQHLSHIYYVYTTIINELIHITHKQLDTLKEQILNDVYSDTHHYPTSTIQNTKLFQSRIWWQWCKVSLHAIHMLKMATIHKQPPLVFEHLIVMYIPSTLKCEARLRTQKDISQENNHNTGTVRHDAGAKSSVEVRGRCDWRMN